MNYINAVSTRRFLIYFRHLQDYIISCSDFDVLTDANFFNLFKQNIFDSDLAFFFCNAEKPINEVASDIYKAYTTIHDNLQNIYYFEIRQANIFKMMLKVIKYACTIIDERGKENTIFSELSPINALRIDTDINPENWFFINNDQFGMRIVYTFLYATISPICPVTCIQPSNFFSFLNKFPKKPLLILDNDSFDLSIDNFVKKHIYKDYPQPEFERFYSAKSECLYIGNKSSEYEYSYTKNMKRLYDKLDLLRNSNPLEFNQYEIVFALEYTPSRAYMVTINYKLYILENVKNIGYVLKAYITSDITDVISTAVYTIKTIPVEKLLTILKCIDDYIKSEPETNLDEDSQVEKNANTGFNKKLCKLSDSVMRKCTSYGFRATIPDFIVYP